MNDTAAERNIATTKKLLEDTMFHMTAPHPGTFAGVPATGKRVERYEITVLHINDEQQETKDEGRRRVHRHAVYVPGTEPRPAEAWGPLRMSTIGLIGS
jgi:hypothetical protein